MGDKVSDYPLAVAINGKDKLDKSNTNDGGVTYNQSQAITVDELMAYINLNIDSYYNVDGTLASKRTVTMAGQSSTWENGNIISKSGLNDNGYLLSNNLDVVRGEFKYDVGLDSAGLSLENASGAFLNALDGYLTLNKDGAILPDPDLLKTSFVLAVDNLIGLTTSGTTYGMVSYSKNNTLNSYNVNMFRNLDNTNGAYMGVKHTTSGFPDLVFSNSGNATGETMRLSPSGLRLGYLVAPPDNSALFQFEQESVGFGAGVGIIRQNDLSEEFIDFKTTVGVGNPIEAVGAKVLTETHFIKMAVNGTFVYIPCGTIA